ncbi:MAG: polysaccharide pyruvyl transferase family protein [Parasphingorhabdus sp.]
MPKFALTGTYSAQNKGDAAMQVSTAASLSKFGANIAILAPFVEKDEPKYAPLEVIYCDRRKLIRSTLNIAAIAIGNLLAKRPSEPHTAKNCVEHTANSDLVIDLSGDMLTEDYGPHVAYSHYLPILRALVLRKPYFICAQSIGPFSLTKPIARFLLNRAAAITVRDEISLEYLKSIGIRQDHLKQTADMAFLLPAEVGNCATSWETLGLDAEKDTLGVSVSRLVADKFDKQVGKKGAFVKLVAKTVNHIALKHDLQVLFTPHVTGPTDIKDDRIISRDVQKILAAEIVSAVIEEDLPPQGLKYFIAKCCMMVGTRMHANIGALSSHLPVIAISYSHKTPGIMRACGVENYVVDFPDLTFERLSERIDSAYANRATLSEKLAIAVEKQRKKAQENVNIAMEIALGERT